MPTTMLGRFTPRRIWEKPGRKPARRVTIGRPSPLRRTAANWSRWPVPTWTRTSATGNRWTSVASSADGTKLVAAADGDANYKPIPIYTSTDSGVTWVTTAPAQFWTSVASSTDGIKLVAVAYGNPNE